MATNEIQTTIWPAKGTEEKKDILSSLKGFFKKSQEWDNNKGNSRLTRAFTLNRKDAVISLIAAVVVLAWMVVYGGIVYKKYSDMNDKKDLLKNLSSYDVSVDNDILHDYINWQDIKTIDGVFEVNKEIQEVLDEREEFQKRQKSYYEVLLQNLYLPSLNVWKNPYTKNFDISVLWQKYLEKDKFQDLYLIQYWSDFIKYVWNDADYNTIDNISIGDVVELTGSDYFYVPITVTFTSPNKRSFLLLVNKLSVTSNTNNIALLNEFFFYLLMNIKEDKADVIQDLMQQYWEEISSSSDWDGPASISEMNEEQLMDYQDKVIWYDLYQWVNYDGTGENKSLLIDDDIIIETIRNSSSCAKSDTNKECFYKFRNKYRDLPYLAYQVGLWWDDTDKYRTTTRTQWLWLFLKDLPPVVAITNFGFNKHVTQDEFFDRKELYEWSVTFNAYGRGISNENLKEAATELWKLCFWENSNNVISPDFALSRINDRIESLWGMDSNVNVSALWELHDLFSTIAEDYDWMSNYNKMIKLFELWRMLKDSNLCDI